MLNGRKSTAKFKTALEKEKNNKKRRLRMESLKKRRIFISLIVATAFLLVATIAYALLGDDDPYKYFSGVGDKFDISPDDKHFLFSNYLNGKEAIYRANGDGTDVIQLTSSETERHHAPKYSRDGKKILFLSKNSERINTLNLANQDGNQKKQLTSNNLHVSEAVFSYSGETIYYVGMPAEDFKKAEGETSKGFDLYSIEIDDGKIKRLTNKNYFEMTSLSVSPDGKEVYYNLFNGNKEIITSFSIETGLEQGKTISEVMPNDSYNFQLSPDGAKLAFTAVSKESQNGSLFEYELFLIDIEKQRTKRLTDLNSSVASPKFFHHKNQIAFLENTNWPQEPAEFDLYVLDLGTEKLQSIHLALSNQDVSHRLIDGVNQLVNGFTIAILYIILFGFLITYLYYYHSKEKSYLPVKISFSLTVVAFISSIVVAFVVDPWFGMGVGMLTAALMVCTFLVFGYAFVLNRFGKKP